MKDRVGERRLNNQGCWMEIVRYDKFEDIDIRFDDGNIVTNKEYGNFKKGAVRNFYHPAIFGVGWVGEGEYNSVAHSKMYAKWVGMIQRCHCKGDLERNPTYSECSIYPPWYNFQNFGKWYEENFKSWMDNTWTLDKDILFKNNKVYSPDTCCFVPNEINVLFTKRQNDRGDLPIGVTFVKRGFKNYESRCLRGDERRYIGNYKTPEEAFYAYKEVKENYIKKVADKWKGKITNNVYQAMYNYQVEIND